LPNLTGLSILLGLCYSVNVCKAWSTSLPVLYK